MVVRQLKSVKTPALAASFTNCTENANTITYLLMRYEVSQQWSYEFRGTWFLRNVGKHLQDYRVL
jgi:hypothetical protein